MLTWIILLFLLFQYKSLRKQDEQILAALEELKKKDNPSEAVVVEFYIDEDGKITKVEKMILKVTGKAKALVQFKDIKGNLAKIDGAPKWAVTDESLAKLTPSADGLSCEVEPMGPVGLCKVQVLADADLGEGIKQILGEAELELIAGEAVVVELALDEVVEAPVPTPEPTPEPTPAPVEG